VGHVAVMTCFLKNFQNLPKEIKISSLVNPFFPSSIWLLKIYKTL